MKLKIKQTLFLLLLATSVIILIAFGPLLGNQLSRYEISDSINLNYEFIILASIFLHFLIGFFIINRIEILKDLGNKYIMLFFSIFYIFFNTIVRLSKNTYTFDFYILDLSLVIGLFLGLIFRKNIKKYSLLVSLSCVIVFLFFTFKVTIPLANQFKVYGNYFGRTYNLKIDGINLIDYNGNKIDLNTKDSKIIVIDFWNNHCAICFKKFPLLKGLQKEYKNNLNVEIIAVNIFSNKEQIKKGEELLYKTKNKDLKNYYMSLDDSKHFNIKSYPKVVVIRDNNIIFEGHIEILRLFRFLYLK